jgi:hypothetical protein
MVVEGTVGVAATADAVEGIGVTVAMGGAEVFGPRLALGSGLVLLITLMGTAILPTLVTVTLPLRRWLTRNQLTLTMWLGLTPSP